LYLQQINIRNAFFTDTELLGIFIFVIYPNSLSQIFSWRSVLIWISIIVIFNSPTWIRNADFGKVGRKLYIYANYDVDRLSFWMQEFRGYAFALFLAVFWQYGEKLKSKTIFYSAKSYTNINLDTFERLALYTKKCFYNWQRDIIIIIAIFLPWSWFYWRNIIYFNDSRYILSAIVIHTFWVVTLIIYSRPFFAIRYSYWNAKIKMLFMLDKEKSNEQSIELIKYLDPYPKEQFAFSSVTALLSLLSPILQMFFK
jgi:hypothetical protein